MPATQLYNEGWLLRLTLSCLEALRLASHPLALQEEARWYSEALLRSRFRPLHRGDPLAESWTHADGVIGHFEIRGRDGGVVAVTERSRQLIVTEAKLFSPLSAGTTRAKTYDQAARNVACMIETLADAECSSTPSLP